MRFICLGKRDFVFLALCFALGVLLISQVSYGVRAVSGKAAGERKLPIYKVETDEKKIAITFDAAWGNSDVDELLSVLKKHNAKATFFFTGQWVSKFPDDVLKIYADGHECANHSDSHAHISSMSAEQLLEDIKACNGKIAAVTGKAPTLYRGPYGEYNNTLLTQVESLKMHAVQWDIDSRDWQKKSVEYMVKSVTENAKNGSIVLFHCDCENTPEALDKILEILSREGYSFVTASELIYKENYTIKHDGTQCKIKNN